MIHYKTSYWTINQAHKKKPTPNTIAITVIRITNLSSSFLRGELGVELEDTSIASYPKTVLSPIFTTTPLPVPSYTRVPKNAKFLVSLAFI